MYKLDNEISGSLLLIICNKMHIDYIPSYQLKMQGINYKLLNLYSIYITL